MRLPTHTCEDRLRRAERATLATVHPVRGVDTVPACFSYADGRVAVPVDRVKEKSGGVLQRVRNLDVDGRAALLCDHWDGRDWSRLWWVRASLERVGDRDGGVDGREELLELLEAKYRQYKGQPFADLLIFRVTDLTGWAASAGAAQG
jgi:Pyridoxamine 5'-phosphate oxidase